MITALFASVVCFAIFYYLLALWCIHAFFSRKRTLPGGWTPPVSILKPVRGQDVEAMENYLSFLRQDYPAYQVLFGVESEEDPAVPVIRRLIDDFPERDVRLIVAGNVSAANKKIGILAALTRQAGHEVLVISDSDVRVAPGYLKEVVAPFHESQVGIVTCLYRARGRTLACFLEALMIHLDFLPGVLVAERLEGLRFGLGATLAIQREALSAIGGFEAIRDYLADDYVLGHRIYQAGYRLVLSTRMVDIVLPPLGIAEFLKHQLRWARTYKVCRPKGYFATILTQGVFFSALYLLLSGFSPAGWILMASAGFARALMAGLILARYLGEPGWLKSLLLLPVKEIVSAAIWALAFLGNRITWKANSFRLDKEGRMIRESEIKGRDNL